MALVPTAVSAIQNVFSSNKQSNSFARLQELKQQALTRKNAPRTEPNDTTKLTQMHYDAVMNAYEENRANNLLARHNNRPTEIVLLPELTTQLNTYFGINKSKTSYARIWNGRVSREEFPEQQKLSLVGS